MSKLEEALKRRETANTHAEMVVARRYEGIASIDGIAAKYAKHVTEEDREALKLWQEKYNPIFADAIRAQLVDDGMDADEAKDFIVNVAPAVYEHGETQMGVMLFISNHAEADPARRAPTSKMQKALRQISEQSSGGSARILGYGEEYKTNSDNRISPDKEGWPPIPEHETTFESCGSWGGSRHYLTAANVKDLATALNAALDEHNKIDVSQFQTAGRAIGG